MLFSFGRKKVDLVAIALGNPGARYSTTRHNSGWILLDSAFPDMDWSNDKYLSSEIAIMNYGKHRILFVKPQTSMNLSGEIFKPLQKHYKFPPDGIVVAHDDIDLPLGKIKISHARGDAGHNGLRSIARHFGSEYTRVRIGISSDNGDGKVIKPAVLGKFTDSELEQLLAQRKIFAKIISTLATAGHAMTMNLFNSKYEKD